jgi:hypothetical protein
MANLQWLERERERQKDRESCKTGSISRRTSHTTHKNDQGKILYDCTENDRPPVAATAAGTTRLDGMDTNGSDGSNDKYDVVEAVAGDNDGDSDDDAMEVCGVRKVAADVVLAKPRPLAAGKGSNGESVVLSESPVFKVSDVAGSGDGGGGNHALAPPGSIGVNVCGSVRGGEVAARTAPLNAKSPAESKLAGKGERRKEDDDMPVTECDMATSAASDTLGTTTGTESVLPPTSKRLTNVW